MTLDETIDALAKLKESNNGHGDMIVKIRYEDHYVSESEEYPETKEVELAKISIESGEIILQEDY